MVSNKWDILPVCQADFLLEWSVFLSSLDHQSNLESVALRYAVDSKVLMDHEVRWKV